MDYFDHSLELEAFLEKQNKTHLLEREFIPNVQIYYTRQPYAKGLGDAIYLGKSFVGGEPFAVLLPDDIILNGTTPAIQQLIEEYNICHQSVIGLNKVEDKHLHKYGVIKGEPFGKEMYQIVDIVEKPRMNPPSNLAVIGRYVFTPSIFTYLETLTRKDGEEIQLTDAIQKMSAAEVCYGKLIEGNRFDIGSHDDYISLINIMNRPTKN